MAFGIATLCATFWFLIPQARYMAEAMKNSGWKNVSGTIVDREEYDDVYERNRKVRKVRLHYEYQVDGKLYRSKRFSFAGNPTKIAGDGLFPNGEDVTVFYDPAHPESAVLRKSWPIFETIVAILLWLMGLTGTLVFTANLFSKDQRTQ